MGRGKGRRKAPQRINRPTIDSLIKVVRLEGSGRKGSRAKVLTSFRSIRSKPIHGVAHYWDRILTYAKGLATLQASSFILRYLVWRKTRPMIGPLSKGMLRALNEKRAGIVPGKESRLEGNPKIRVISKVE